jgi:hypothetical protein
VFDIHVIFNRSARDAPGVMDAFAMSASARLFPFIGSGHQRILSRGKTAGRRLDGRLLLYHPVDASFRTNLA